MHQLGGGGSRRRGGPDGGLGSPRGGRSRWRARKSAFGAPAAFSQLRSSQLGATHQDEEEGEAETLDNTEKLDEASVVGKLRSSAAAEIS